MANLTTYTITKENGIQKLATQLRGSLYEMIIAEAVKQYGEENVKWVRVGTDSSEKNTVAVRVCLLLEDGCEYEYCAKIDVSMASYKVRTVKGKDYDPFDFETSAQAYENWIIEKGEKEKAKAEAKAKKIAAKNKKKTTEEK